MTASASTRGSSLLSAADQALKLVVGFWFLVTLLGQWMFAYYIAGFYGGAAARGSMETWNKVLTHGYTAGDIVGNTALAMHLLFAAIITFIGLLQLIPQLRARWPALHRWLGRSYLLIAFTMGITGLYLTLSGRRLVGGGALAQHIAIDINAVLIIVC